MISTPGEFFEDFEDVPEAYMEFAQRLMAKFPEEMSATTSWANWKGFLDRNFPEFSDRAYASSWAGIEKQYAFYPQIEVNPERRYFSTGTYMTYRDKKTGRFTSFSEVQRRIQEARKLWKR